MPQVILIALVLIKPTDGAAFSSYLTNQSICAFDRLFGNSANGTLGEQAQDAWIPNSGINAFGLAFTSANQPIVHYSSQNGKRPQLELALYDIV